MKRSKFVHTVRFEPEHYSRLETLACEQGKPVSDLVRTAIGTFLDGAPKISASQFRHLRVTEYVQVALDAIIRENHPELCETLVLEAGCRMKLNHGA